MVRPLAEFVVSIGTDGSVVAQGTVLEVLGAADEAVAEILKENEVVTKTTENEANKPAPPASGGKPILAEEVELGHIGWRSRMLYLRSKLCKGF